MKLISVWVLPLILAYVFAQSGDSLLSIIVSDAVSVFTSVTSFVGSQLSTATDSNAITTATLASSSSSSTPSSRSTYSTTFSSSASTPTSKTSSTIPTNTATSSSTQPTGVGAASSSDHSRNLSIILGAVLGSLALGFLILLLIVLCCRRRRRATSATRHNSFSSTSTDTIHQEKQSRSHDEWTKHSNRRSFHRDHAHNRIPQSSQPHLTSIPPAHGMVEDAYIPATSERLYDRYAPHNRYCNSMQDERQPLEQNRDQRNDPMIVDGSKVSDGAFEYHGRKSSRHSPKYQANDYHDVAHLPSRSPNRNSLNAARSRKRSVSATGERPIVSPYQPHDPMPVHTPELGTTRTLTGNPTDTVQRHPDHLKRNGRTLMNIDQGSQIDKAVPSEGVYELSDTSQDTELEHLRRTGTLTRNSASSTKDLVGYHELSAPAVISKQSIPGIPRNKPDVNTQRTSHPPLQSNPPSGTAQASKLCGIAPLSTAIPNSNAFARKSKYSQPDRQVYEQYIGNPWSPDDVGRAIQGEESSYPSHPPNLTPVRTEPSNGSFMNIERSEQALVASDPQTVSVQSQSLDPSKTEHQEMPEGLKSGLVSAVIGKFEFGSENMADRPSDGMTARQKSNHRVSHKSTSVLSNTSQPLRSNPSHTPAGLDSLPGRTVRQTDLESAYKFDSDIPDTGLNGRWNSRGRWKKDGDEGQWISPHSHYSTVGQAM